MKIYRADCRENDHNTYYPHECEIQTAQELAAAVRYDHMICRMKNHTRRGENFEQCDGIMFDLDNTHTDDPNEWRTEKDIAEALPVNYYLVRSRNYMKEKRTFNKKTGETAIHEPREKWHVYAPLKTPITDPSIYKTLMLNILALFPFIDASADDNARLFYGVEKPHVTFEDNEICIDEYISGLDPEAMRREQEDNLAEFIANVQSGRYKNYKNKGIQATIKQLCDFLKVKNPFSDEQEKPRTEPAAAADGVPDWIDYAERTKSLQWFEEWANYYGVPLGRRVVNRTQTIAISTPCPWEEEHSMNGAENEAVILIDAAGKIGFLCRHSHGGALSWHDFRDYYENRPGAPQKRPQKAPGTAYNDFADKNTGSGIKSPGKAAESATAAAGGQAEPRPDNTSRYIDSMMQADIERLQAAANRKTGFDELDTISGGLYPGLYVIAATSSLGKTTFALQIADNLAAAGQDVLFFSLEQSRLELVSKSFARIIAQKRWTEQRQPRLQGDYEWYKVTGRTMITSLGIRRGQAPEALQAAAAQYKEAIADRLSIIEGNFDCNISFISDYVRQYIQRNKCRPVVFVDYLQILQPADETRRMTTKEAVDYTVTELKRISRDLDLTVFVISSVNRANYLTPIDFESLKESGGIEYTADVIWGLQLQCLHDPLFDDPQKKIKEKRKMIKQAKASDPRQIELSCLKNRYGIANYSCAFDYYPSLDLFVQTKYGDFNPWYLTDVFDGARPGTGTRTGKI